MKDLNLNKVPSILYILKQIYLIYLYLFVLYFYQNSNIQKKILFFEGGGGYLISDRFNSHFWIWEVIT